MSNKNKIMRKQSKYGKKAVSDESLKFLIDEAFRRRVSLRSNRIRVTAQEGVVKLWGSVSSFEEQQKAEQAVKVTPGVHKVENYLKIEH